MGSYPLASGRKFEPWPLGQSECERESEGGDAAGRCYCPKAIILKVKYKFRYFIFGRESKIKEVFIYFLLLK